MANRMRGEASLGEHTLVFSFNVMCLLEEQTGLKTGQLIQMMQQNMGLTDLRAFIWAGLQEKQPGTSIEQAGEIIGEVGIEPAMEALQQAVEAAFSSDEPESGKANPRKAARTGTG